jgi:hypothetical protein
VEAKENTMTATQIALDWIEKLFGVADEATPEFTEPTILVGDEFYWNDYEVEVVSIEETCPFAVCPIEWEVWGTEGAWAYVVAVDNGIPATSAMSRRRAEYVPLDFLTMISLEN